MSEYETLKLISESDDREVFLVRNTVRDELFLLKRLKETDLFSKKDIDKRIKFRKEINIIASLDHTNIAKIKDTFFDGKNYSIIYCFREGKTLNELIKEKNILSPKEALTLTIQLLDALEYIHLREIFHCDINPHNIFIDNEKGITLIDFGNALTEEDTFKFPHNRINRIIGTPPFISLEQLGFINNRIDARSDLFCTAMILYRLLSGKLPFDIVSDDVNHVLNQILKSEVTPIKNISEKFNTILVKALRPTPEERYQTAVGFKNDLNIILDEFEGISSKSFIIGRNDDIAAINKAKLFVAREKEISSLCEGLALLKNNIHSSYLLHGFSGIGKTNIVTQFRLTVTNEDIWFLYVRCNRFTPSHPYSIFRLITLELLLKLSTSSEKDNELFRSIISEKLIDHSGVIVRIINEMGDYFSEIKDIYQVEPEKEADHVNYILTLFLQTVFLFRPIILCIDDFQWVDHTTFDILKNLLRIKPRSMMIFNFRTEKDKEDVYLFNENMKNSDIGSIIAVECFKKNEIEELIFSRFGSIEGNDILINILMSKTDCSPFALTEAIRYLVNTGMLNNSFKGWILDKKGIHSIPDKFDTVSLILNKLDLLHENEQRYLMLASLIEGKFQNFIVEKIGGFHHSDTVAYLHKLENLGFIHRLVHGGFSFSHEKIKEVLQNKYSREEKLQYHEKLAALYESLIPENKEYLFNAAECYCKSSELNKAIQLCYQAALYAKEKVALNVSIYYFKRTILLLSSLQTTPGYGDLDITKVNIEYGEVLMLIGKNDEALKICTAIVESDSSINKEVQRELLYKIGTIYNNVGDFKHATPYFLKILEIHKIKLPQNRLSLYALLFFELIKHFFLIPVKKCFFPKKKDNHLYLLIKILNKLSYSFYFEDMLLCIVTHLKALNLSNQIPDCFEKTESYALHGFISYQFFLKKRSFRYFKKALKISDHIHRIDSYAFTQYLYGIVLYFNAQWKKSEALLLSSVHNFSSIGDIHGQIQSLVQLWLLNYTKGSFDRTEKFITHAIRLSKQINEKNYLTSCLSALYALNVLKTGIVNESLYKEIMNLLNQSTFPLTYSNVESFFLKSDILQNKLHEASHRADSIYKQMHKKFFNLEYNTSFVIIYGDLLTTELKNRYEGIHYLSMPKDILLKELKKCIYRLWFSSKSYPAYHGYVYRNLAWYYLSNTRTKKAHRLFIKSINCFHDADMRYEEARSMRDFGLFLDECNHPGKSRDMFNKAFRLFYLCGAHLECQNIKGKVDRDTRAIIIDKTEKKSSSEKLSSSQSSQFSNLSQIRLDTIYDISSSITQISDINVLFRQILSAMIKATGAQFAWLFIEKNERYENNELCIDFHGNILNHAEIPYSREIIKRVKAEKKSVLVNDVSKEIAHKKQKMLDDTARISTIRSVLCVPLTYGKNYLGCIYLGNNIVSGLFSEESKKVVHILSAQTGILLEYALLMDKYKKLNKYLEQKVNAQTKDIREKNNQLISYNIKLVESERMRSILTGTLVHDIKNYASSVEANIKPLLRHYQDNDPIKTSLDLAKSSCYDIVSLASNLLDIGKMEESKLEPKKELISYEKILGIADKFKNHILFKERNMRINVVKPDEHFVLEADSSLLTRVLENLFNNAAKYGAKDGEVVIMFESVEHEDIISFFCSGPPIPDKFKEVIFEKDARIDGSRSMYSKGLGLFFCKLVAQVHQGNIWLETDQNGNYFKISFKKSLINTSV